MSKTLVLSGTGILLITLFASCAFPFQSAEVAGLSDISGRLAFYDISRQGFMGGSVLYNPDQPSSGQLVEGAHVAVRLGYVAAETVGAGQTVFNDDAAKAQFGLLTVTGIDETKIVFKVNRYDVSGVFLGEVVHTLSINENVDINGDGCVDPEYKKPVKKHAGFENAVYLNFLSSQETLNTTMFAVLQEQYARHVYPSGIIGINPAGQFIYSKYEFGSENRAVLSGIQKGDIVLDGATGKYQKISRPASQMGARAVSESELVDIDESGVQFSVLFSADDFVNIDAVEALFMALPESLKLKAVGGNVIDKLNMLLSSADFIPLLAQERPAELGATVGELSAAFTALPALSVEERLQANRSFLEMLYPELCPLMAARGDGFASVLPLVSVIIDSGVPAEEAEDIGSNRAANQAEYHKQRSKINAKFAVYKEVLSIPLQLPNEVLREIPGSSSLNGSLKTGIKGSFNNTWGNISGGIEGVIYITADAYVDCSNWGLNKLKNFPVPIGNLQVKDFIIPKTDLFSVSDICKNIVRKPIPGGLTVKPFTRSINIPVVCFGPVTLNVRLGTGFNLYVETNLGVALKASGSVTALYGGRAEVGINYGVSRKPILKIFGRTILSIPVPYISPYAQGSKVKEDSFQLSAEATEMELAYFGIADASVLGTLALTPAIHGEIGANICQIVGLDLGMEHGIELSVKPSLTAGFNSATGINFPTVKVPGEASYVGALYLKPWVGLKVDIIGFIGFEKRIDLYTTKAPLGSTNLYSQTFGAEECWAKLVKTLDAQGTWGTLEKKIGKDAVRSLKEEELSAQQALAMLKSYIPFHDLLKLTQGIVL
ncbi:MAG: hypothetical protein LBK62_08305 [Treponema sp.]|jgi:hypothetical protein|nr:hypothetical protein [Treponema sp.]